MIVPNAKLAQAIVTSYAGGDFGFAVELQVHHRSDLALVERETLAAARDAIREVAGVVPTAEPAVRFLAFGPTGISLSVGLRAREFRDQFLLKHELLKRVHARYAQAGIALPMVDVVVPSMLGAPGGLRSGDSLQPGPPS